MEGRRSWKVEQLFVVFPCRIFGPYGSQAEKELTTTKMQFGPFGSLYWH